MTNKVSESILSKRRAKSTKIGLKETKGNKVLFSSKMYKYIESVHASKFGHATISVRERLCTRLFINLETIEQQIHLI